MLEYDQLGNVISLGDDNLEWSNGKELKKYYNSDNIYNYYYYNDNGIRTKKIINGFTTDYYLEDSNIFLEKNDNYTLFFIREFDNSLVEFKYNNNLYYYVKDAFDSIIEIFQIIHFCFFIIIIASISKRINICNMTHIITYIIIIAIKNTQDITPSIIFIFCNNII